MEEVMRQTIIIGLITGAGLYCAMASSACAQETTTYTYDALGRVISVVHNSGPISGTTTTYNYDFAGNRTSVNVTGSPNGSSNGAGSGASAVTRFYVVTPLNGLTPIVVNQ
jgi:hypothetical protein